MRGGNPRKVKLWTGRPDKTSAITKAAATIPSLEREELEEFLAALDLLKEHKQYAAADAYAEGEVELSQQLAAAADAAITGIAAGKAALQDL